MSVVYVLLSIVYVLACFFLCFVVLIQKGEGGGLGGAFGGGAVDVAFGAKADMTWKRATAVAASLFMILAVVLGIMDNYRGGTSIAADAQPDAPAATQGEDGPATPEELERPGLEDGGDAGTLEEPEAPADGAAPSGDR